MCRELHPRPAAAGADLESSASWAEGGAAWVTVHARTRAQGYAPPVHWPLVGRVRERVGIPVVANGDIRTVGGLRRCRDETGCRHFMLGRGAVADPGLAGRAAAELGLAGPPPAAGPIDWPAELRRLVGWTPAGSAGGLVKRLKQWLRMAAAYGTFARFDEVKRAGCAAELLAVLDGPVREPAAGPADEGEAGPGWAPPASESPAASATTPRT